MTLAQQTIWPFLFVVYGLTLAKPPDMSTPGFPIPVIGVNDPLPPAQNALGADSPWKGLVAAGTDLSARRLLEAYTKGIFPWYNQDQMVLWWSTDPRMVLKPSQFKWHRSFKKDLIKTNALSALEIKVDHDFCKVMRMCATQQRPHQDGTWIHAEMEQAYAELHRLGHGHSVETWINGELVGGLYCVSIGNAVFGESMFSAKTNASKMALAALVSFCLQSGIDTIDCQQQTHHLASLGASPVDREIFLKGLESAVKKPPPDWKLLPVYWQQFLAPAPQPT